MSSTVQQLQSRLQEAEELLRAIRSGEVDAVVVSGPHGDQVYTLSGAEHPYRVMVETMSEGAVIVSGDGTIFYSNRSFAAMLHTPLDELIGSTIDRFVLPEDVPRYETLVHHRRGGASKAEIRLAARSGVVVPVYLSISSFESGTSAGACMVITDLSEHKRHQELIAAEALERTKRAEAESGQRRIANILESITDSFFSLDREWWITDANQRAATNFGRTRDELVGKLFWHVSPPGRIPELDEQYRRAMKQRVAIHSEAPSAAAQGRWFERHIYPTDEGLAVYFRDITERKEEELERQELLRRLVVAQEDERRRIALEMHDQFGQQLSALVLKISALTRDRGRRTNLGEQLASLEAITRQLDTDLDLIVSRLRPPALDDLGLVAALTNYVTRWSGHFDVHADLHATGIEPGQLTDEIDTALYRIAQEALNNVAKHAQAANVAILLDGRPNRVSLIVEDDGIGVDMESVGSRHRFGVVGMRERAKLLGGTLDIESHSGKGTTVVARIPVPPYAQRKST